MRILFLSRWFPYPPDNGSKIRISNLIATLSSMGTVDLISFTSDSLSSAQLAESHKYCDTVKAIEYRSFNPGSLQAVLGFFSLKPRFLVDTYNQDFEHAVVDLVARNPYDLVIVSQIDMTPYVGLFQNQKVILDEIELTIIAKPDKKNTLRYLWSRLTWAKYQIYLRKVLKQVQGCTTVSKNELEMLRRLAPKNLPIAVIPNGIQVAQEEGEPAIPERHSLIYAGALSYYANLDAVRYFIQEILPEVKRACPDVKLYVTGKADPELISKLPNDDRVIFTGYIENIRARIESSWLSIVPLRIGGGTRLKIIESMAYGTPVISTSKGAEGLDLIPGKEILIADEPAKFAAEIIRVFNVPGLREELSQNGKKAIMSKYDWKSISQDYIRFIDQALSAFST